MEIRLRATGQVVTEQEFRAMRPNTSFPVQLDDATLDAFGADVLFEGPQAQPTRYQTAFRDGVQQMNGKWYTKYSVADISDDAKAAVDARQADAVRATRNQKLKDSDWTQVVDAPVSQMSWAAYRQALRDVPSQVGFPWDVQWPTEP